MPAPEAVNVLLAASVISAAAPRVRATMLAAVIVGNEMLLVEVRVTSPSGVVPPHAPLKFIDPAVAVTFAAVLTVLPNVMLPEPALSAVLPPTAPEPIPEASVIAPPDVLAAILAATFIPKTPWEYN